MELADSMVLLLSEAEIQSGVARLAGEIDRDYDQAALTLVCILRGAAIFTADLLRHLRANVRRVVYIRASSYGAGTESSGHVRITRAPRPEHISGQHILIVDDIADTGHTGAAVANFIRRLNPASLRYCALLDKPARREASMQYDYMGFTIPNYFVVGYGMDLNGRYRELPAVYYFPDG